MRIVKMKAVVEMIRVGGADRQKSKRDANKKWFLAHQVFRAEPRIRITLDIHISPVHHSPRFYRAITFEGLRGTPKKYFATSGSHTQSVRPCSRYALRHSAPLDLHMPDEIEFSPYFVISHFAGTRVGEVDMGWRRSTRSGTELSSRRALGQDRVSIESSTRDTAVGITEIGIRARMPEF
jgi:hypothetical protein